jgi:hypothetical protein
LVCLCVWDLVRLPYNSVQAVSFDNIYRGEIWLGTTYRDTHSGRLHKHSEGMLHNDLLVRSTLLSTHRLFTQAYSFTILASYSQSCQYCAISSYLRLYFNQDYKSYLFIIIGFAIIYSIETFFTSTFSCQLWPSTGTRLFQVANV